MATERIEFDFPGALGAAQTSQQKRATYVRTLAALRPSLLGGQSVGGDITFKLRLAGVEQGATYTLSAGLTSAEITGLSVTCPANTWTDFVIVDGSTGSDLKVEAEFTVAVSSSGGSTTDLGLGTLGQLKRFVLAAGIVAETTYDEALTFIGKGMAGLIDRHCNRTFKRGVSVTEDFRGGTDILLLARYPVESVASIGWKSTGESSFTTQADVVDTVAYHSGVVVLTSELGSERDQLRATYTGGYWYDTSDDGTGTQPTDAALLPLDVQMIWLLECQHTWQSRDALGIQHTQTEGGSLLNTRLGILELSPAAKDVLEPYRRLML